MIAMASLALAASCTAGGTGPSGGASRESGLPSGGTLRVVMPEFQDSPLTGAQPVNEVLDPQMSYFYDTWELDRCCLLRTLLSYSGKSTRDGGTQLRPDLAAGMPSVSSDGLTWTFRLKPGLRYAPPLEDTEITAGDIARAVTRMAVVKSHAPLGSYSFYYSSIEGFDDVTKGIASSISGIQAPDAHTLVVRLTRPDGDLGFLFALAATAPIPPMPGDPSAPLGVATGHDSGYGPFLVASGPYMIEGSAQLDFSLPPGQQQPVAGLRPGHSLVLVRNPAWDRSSDALRAADPDRIDVTVVRDQEQAAQEVQSGKADLMLFVGPPPQVPPDVAAKVAADRSLGRLEINPRDFVRYLVMNLAQPPFDDIHVRKAVSYVIDKQALIEAGGGGPLIGSVANHIAPDSLEGNLLLGYDPYPTPGNRGSVSLARREMSLSKYDANADGICDSPVCQKVRAVALALAGTPLEARVPLVERDLARIGIHLQVAIPEDPFGALSDPRQHIAMGISPAWGKDFPSGSNFLAPNFSSSTIGSNNFALVGAKPAQLQSWGYPVKSVPSVDSRIAQCTASLGQQQVACWANLDKYLMQEVVPWVPYIVESHTDLVSPRVASYSYDQAISMPALDRIALRRGSAAEAGP